MLYSLSLYHWYMASVLVIYYLIVVAAWHSSSWPNFPWSNTVVGKLRIHAFVVCSTFCFKKTFKVPWMLFRSLGCLNGSPDSGCSGYTLNPKGIPSYWVLTLFLTVSFKSFIYFLNSLVLQKCHGAFVACHLSGFLFYWGKNESNKQNIEEVLVCSLIKGVIYWSGAWKGRIWFAESHCTYRAWTPLFLLAAETWQIFMDFYLIRSKFYN